jgi:cytidine deaminase
MRQTSKRLLIAAATRVRANAVAPYSGFRVGAALATTSGRIFTGANIESASYGLTCCAERVALFKALSEGARDFAAIAVVAEIEGGAMPCGACRQLLAEYAPNASVWIADPRRPNDAQEFSVQALLPQAFVAIGRKGKRIRFGRNKTSRLIV